MQAGQRLMTHLALLGYYRYTHASWAKMTPLVLLGYYTYKHAGQAKMTPLALLSYYTDINIEGRQRLPLFDY